jgi:hypothetical protein
MTSYVGIPLIARSLLGYCCNETLYCLLLENALEASRMVDIFAQ